MANEVTGKGFQGHTPRQHRATSRKGGLARIAKISGAQQRAWSRKGGEANRARLQALSDLRTAKVRSVDVD